MNRSNFKAIPTSYDGIAFRSRLEAKWAAFFHMMGWNYEYEPVDLNGYIPDFVLVGCKTPIYVEVKPALTMKELREMCDKARRSTLGKKLLCLGATIGYPEEFAGVKKTMGALVSRINLCDSDIVEMYGRWFGDGNTDPDEWDADDPSAQQCILGYYEEAEVRACHDINCQKRAPISLGYRNSCCFCGTKFPDVWEWEDHKADWAAVEDAWKEAGNIIQYRFAKS